MYKFLLLFLLMPCMASAQYHKAVKDKRFPNAWIGKELVGKEALLAKKYCTCFNGHQYNAAQRRSFFPFNTADTVRLISFIVAANRFEPVDLDNYKDSLVKQNAVSIDTAALFTPMAPNNFKINYSLVKESVVITKAQIDSLTDILYNVSNTPIKLPFDLLDPSVSCYNPKNEILFINNRGIVENYIELCFECSKYYFSSSKIRSIETCDQKYDLIKAFFLGCGIKHGTISPKGEED